MLREAPSKTIANLRTFFEVNLSPEDIILLGFFI